MSRLVAAARSDLRLQVRYGIVAATAFVLVLWIVLLHRVPPVPRAAALPFVLFADTGIVGLFFLPGLVLFEKDERTLPALAVTPLRDTEYLAAKVGTLTGLAVAASAVVTLASGVRADLALVVLGVVLLSVVASLAAFLVVARCAGIVEFVLAVQLPALPLALPLVAVLGWLESPLFHLVPTHGPLVLLAAAVRPVSAAELVAAVLSPVPWIGVLWWRAVRARRLAVEGG